MYIFQNTLGATVPDVSVVVKQKKMYVPKPTNQQNTSPVHDMKHQQMTKPPFKARRGDISEIHSKIDQNQNVVVHSSIQNGTLGPSISPNRSPVDLNKYLSQATTTPTKAFADVLKMGKTQAPQNGGCIKRPEHPIRAMSVSSAYHQHIPASQQSQHITQSGAQGQSITQSRAFHGTSIRRQAMHAMEHVPNYYDKNESKTEAGFITLQDVEQGWSAQDQTQKYYTQNNPHHRSPDSYTDASSQYELHKRMEQWNSIKHTNWQKNHNENHENGHPKYKEYSPCTPQKSHAPDTSLLETSFCTQNQEISQDNVPLNSIDAENSSALLSLEAADNSDLKVNISLLLMF